MPASTPRWSTPSTVAPWPGRRPTLGLAAAIVASVLSGAAMADPLIHNSSVAGSPMAGSRQGGSQGGSPGGMLRAPSAAPYAVYSAVYGIDRGTCDRRLVARDMSQRQIVAEIGSLAPGRSMDVIDLGCVSRVLEYAPDRQTIRWYGAGHDGLAFALTPLATFERNGLFCRDYRAVASRDGEDRQNYGTACRQPDGLWRAGD
jgi:hypothetical protein